MARRSCSASPLHHRRPDAAAPYGPPPRRTRPRMHHRAHARRLRAMSIAYDRVNGRLFAAVPTPSHLSGISRRAIANGIGATRVLGHPNSPPTPAIPMAAAQYGSPCCGLGFPSAVVTTRPTRGLRAATDNHRVMVSTSPRRHHGCGDDRARPANITTRTANRLRRRRRRPANTCGMNARSAQPRVRGRLFVPINDNLRSPLSKTARWPRAWRVGRAWSPTSPPTVNTSCGAAERRSELEACGSACRRRDRLRSLTYTLYASTGVNHRFSRSNSPPSTTAGRHRRARPGQLHHRYVGSLDRSAATTRASDVPCACQTDAVGDRLFVATAQHRLFQFAQRGGRAGRVAGLGASSPHPNPTVGHRQSQLERRRFGSRLACRTTPNRATLRLPATLDFLPTEPPLIRVDATCRPARPVGVAARRGNRRICIKACRAGSSKSQRRVHRQRHPGPAQRRSVQSFTVSGDPATMQSHGQSRTQIGYAEVTRHPGLCTRHRGDPARSSRGARHAAASPHSRSRQVPADETPAPAAGCDFGGIGGAGLLAAALALLLRSACASASRWRPAVLGYGRLRRHSPWRLIFSLSSSGSLPGGAPPPLVAPASVTPRPQAALDASTRRAAGRDRGSRCRVCPASASTPISRRLCGEQAPRPRCRLAHVARPGARGERRAHAAEAHVGHAKRAPSAAQPSTSSGSAALSRRAAPEPHHARR